MTSCTGSVVWGFGGFEKKQWVEFLPPNERIEIQSWVRPDDIVRYGRRALVGLWADDVKAVSIESLCLSLSSCRISFNSKVIKSFVPEPISWISCFRIPIYVYEHFMNMTSISHIRIMGMLQLHTRLFWFIFPLTISDRENSTNLFIEHVFDYQTRLYCKLFLQFIFT